MAKIKVELRITSEVDAPAFKSGAARELARDMIAQGTLGGKGLDELAVAVKTHGGTTRVKPARKRARTKPAATRSSAAKTRRGR